MLFKNEIFNLQLWPDSIFNNSLATMMVMVTSKFTKILVLKGEEEVQGKCEENIANNRNDDDSGGHIGTKNPVLNDWNKIYRGADFVSGRQ